jgi:hypothetical protein
MLALLGRPKCATSRTRRRIRRRTTTHPPMRSLRDQSWWAFSRSERLNLYHKLLISIPM